MSSEDTTQNQENKPSNQNNNSQNQPETYYQRKKNWIGGVDNDTVNLLLGLGALGVAAVAAYPVARDVWNNFTQRVNQQNQYVNPYNNNNQQPNNDEAYIPPTEPNTPPPVPEPPVVEQPVVVEETKEETKEEEDDGVFYEKELRRKQKLMGRRPTGSRYESPFGKDVGGIT